MRLLTPFHHLFGLAFRDSSYFGHCRADKKTLICVKNTLNQGNTCIHYLKTKYIWFSSNEHLWHVSLIRKDMRIVDLVHAIACSCQTQIVQKITTEMIGKLIKMSLTVLLTLFFVLCTSVNLTFHNISCSSFSSFCFLKMSQSHRSDHDTDQKFYFKSCYSVRF